MRAVGSPVILDVALLIEANPGTISLGQGVVHYGPPPQALEAVSRFGHEVADNHYQGFNGIPELVSGLERKLAVENAIRVGADQGLVVTAGSNMAFFHIVLAICDPGDEVIIISPFFFNHEMAIRMASCRPVLVPADDRYQPQLDLIRDAVSRHTRAIVTISPNNPAGAVYPREDLVKINRLCAERGLYHISDEAYEHFTYENAEHFSPGSIEGNAPHTISLFSFSKTYGLASWRVGYMVTPAHLLEALDKIQDTILICPPVVSQRAAVGALRGGPNTAGPSSMRSPRCAAAVWSISRRWAPPARCRRPRARSICSPSSTPPWEPWTSSSVSFGSMALPSSPARASVLQIAAFSVFRTAR